MHRINLYPDREDNNGNPFIIETSLYGKNRIVVKHAGQERCPGKYELTAEQDRVGEFLQDLGREPGDFFDHIITEG